MPSQGTQSVDRALDVLDIISREGPITLMRISERAELTTATAHRLVKSLSRRGLVSFEPGSKEYTLGPEMVRLAYGVLRNNNLVELTRAGLASLTKFCGETTSLFSIGATDLLCVAEVPSDEALRFNAGLGRTMPLLSGAPGKAAAAWLSEDRIAYVIESAGMNGRDAATLTKELHKVREDGYAMSFGEVVSDTGAMAAPVLDGLQNPVAVISIAGPAGRWTKARMLDTLPLLREVTTAASKKLGG